MCCPRHVFSLHVSSFLPISRNSTSSLFNLAANRNSEIINSEFRIMQSRLTAIIPKSNWASSPAQFQSLRRAVTTSRIGDPSVHANDDNEPAVLSGEPDVFLLLSKLLLKTPLLVIGAFLRSIIFLGSIIVIFWSSS